MKHVNRLEFNLKQSNKLSEMIKVLTSRKIERKTRSNENFLENLKKSICSLSRNFSNTLNFSDALRARV